MKRKRQFEVDVQTKLIVHAFDATTATKKVDEALKDRRHLGPDVTATGEVWSNAGRQIVDGEAVRVRSSGAPERIRTSKSF